MDKHPTLNLRRNTPCDIRVARSPDMSRRDLLSAAAIGAGAALICPAHGFAATLAAAELRHKLRALAGGFDGRVGIGVQDSSGLIAINGDRRFPMQSVMKLVVAATVMDSVDRRGWSLDKPVVVYKKDLSLNIQPLAALVTSDGYRTTLGDLVFRAVVDSDSAATDILFARVGGQTGIREFLARNGIEGVRVDRDERHLQTEICGLTWRPEYVDAAVLQRARNGVSVRRSNTAFRAYLRDPRDTATPAGMTSFLYKLATGKLLSAASTRHLLNVMGQTATFPDRLKAGIPPGWTIGHKTGTSQTWNGVNGVTNDVGILTTPDGHTIAIAVFVAESRRSPEQRAALISRVAQVVTSEHR